MRFDTDRQSVATPLVNPGMVARLCGDARPELSTPPSEVAGGR